MTLSHELPGESTLWQNINKAVQPLVEEALLEAGISESDIRWTEMRWDVPDITASWPKGSPNRNIHAWITRSWPRFFLEVEGAVWEDDEQKLQRRIRFFPFPGRPGGPAAITTVSGLASNPLLTILNKDDLGNGLNKLASELSTANLDNGASTHPLQPAPHVRGRRP